MINALSSRLQHMTRGWVVLALLAAFVLWEAVTLPFLAESPGGNINPLDARFFYMPAEAFATVASYGDAKPFWIRTYLTWDIVNPILYSLFFALAISWLFRMGFAPQRAIQRANLIPLAAGMFDLIENASFVTLLSVFPSQPESIAWLATACTVGKVLALGVSVLLLIVGFAAAVTSRLRRD